MYWTKEQSVFAKRLKGLTDPELFEKMRSVRGLLKMGSSFRTLDQDLLWQSLALEAEITDRFPEKRLEPFRAWLKRREPTVR